MLRYRVPWERLQKEFNSLQGEILSKLDAKHSSIEGKIDCIKQTPDYYSLDGAKRVLVDKKLGDLRIKYLESLEGI